MPHWLPLPLSSATTSHSGLRCPGQRGALGRPSPRKGARHPFEEPTKRPPPRPGALRGAPAGALLDCPCPARHPRKAQAGSRTPLRRWPRSPSRRLGGARCGATAPPKVWRCVGPGGDPPPRSDSCNGWPPPRRTAGGAQALAGRKPPCPVYSGLPARPAPSGLPRPDGSREAPAPTGTRSPPPRASHPASPALAPAAPNAPKPRPQAPGIPPPHLPALLPRSPGLLSSGRSFFLFA